MREEEMEGSASSACRAASGIFVGLICTVLVLPGIARAQDTYKIGVGLPLSGPAAPTGQVFRPGYEAAVKFVNTAGLLKGSVQAVFEDNQCAPAATVAAVQKFVSVEHVTTITAVCSSAILAAAPIAQRNEVPLINASASSPSMIGVGDYVVSLNPLLNGELPPVLAYAAETLKAKSIAVVYSEETLGKTAVQAVDRMAPGLGMKVVGSVSVDPTKSSDFSGQVAKLRAMQPDAIYVGMVGGAEAMLTAIREAGIQAQILSFDLFNTPQITGLSAAQGAIYAVQYFDLKSADPITSGFLKTFAADNIGQMPNSGQVQAANSIVLSAVAMGELQKEGKEVSGANVLELIKRKKQFGIIGGTTTIKYPGGYTVGAIGLIKIDNKKIDGFQVISGEEVGKLQTKAGL
jgi:branched-chain amino acid transport system substrate-binding protein